MTRPETTTDAHSMAGRPRPRIVLSKCLEVEACRYNGQMVRSFAVRSLDPWVEFVPICPEVEVGLGTPRDPIRLVRIEDRTHLVQPSTGRDVTSDMRSFGDRFLGELGDVDGFLLKSKSPSCGIDGIKVYAAPENAPPIDKEPGMFATAVLDRFPDTPVEHEGRLTNLRIRDGFLTRIFALADLRRVGKEGRMSALVEFQARHKLTLMAYSPSLQRELGRIVANPDKRPFPEVFESYGEVFRQALSGEPGPGAHQNVLQHAQGFFKEGLSGAEKAHFGALLGDYRQGKVGRGTLLALVQSWIHRFQEPYLAQQAYLDPYPRDLLDLADSGGSGRL
jgi:uncharacterized protein YbgA (DUF1722 family)/uncharacterized protein YbbK (DUF523 family)